MSTKLKEAIERAIPVAERKKSMLEVSKDVEAKMVKMANLFVKSEEGLNALIDGFTDWFESDGKRKVGLKDTDYSLDDMDILMGIVTNEFKKALK